MFEGGYKLDWSLFGTIELSIIEGVIMGDSHGLVLSAGRPLVISESYYI